MAFFPDDPNNTSSVHEMQRYMNKISGPLLDRIDIHIEVQKVEFEQLSEKGREKKQRDQRKSLKSKRYSE